MASNEVLVEMFKALYEQRRGFTYLWELRGDTSAASYLLHDCYRIYTIYPLGSASFEPNKRSTRTQNLTTRS